MNVSSECNFPSKINSFLCQIIFEKWMKTNYIVKNFMHFINIVIVSTNYYVYNTIIHNCIHIYIIIFSNQSTATTASEFYRKLYTLHYINLVRIILCLLFITIFQQQRKLIEFSYYRSSSATMEKKNYWENFHFPKLNWTQTTQTKKMQEFSLYSEITLSRSI